MESKKKKLKTKRQRGITLIALVVTIVVLLILASVSITVVFGDNGILQLAKEAGEKTNEAVQNDKENIGNMTNYIKSLNWDTSKVTAVTTKDGVIVPVPKGFVGSEVDGENTIKDGFVIYEGDSAVTNENVEQAKTTRNQFVWVPADGVSLEYKQDKKSWKEKEIDSYKDYTDWKDDEEIDFRETSVETYGGFYVGRYEAGLPNSNEYNSESPYEKEDTKNTTEGTPEVRKGYAAWNFVNQINAKILSENMYGKNEKFNKVVNSRLIDSYAWDTICTWLSNSKIDIMDCKEWGNYWNAGDYDIDGLYAIHTWSNGEDKTADSYNKGKITIPGSQMEGENYVEYELATGVSERNKANNIYDFAGNIYEWTTEYRYSGENHEERKTKEAVRRGGRFDNDSWKFPVTCREGLDAANKILLSTGFRIVLYIR